MRKCMTCGMKRPASICDLCGTPSKKVRSAGQIAINGLRALVIGIVLFLMLSRACQARGGRAYALPTHTPPKAHRHKSVGRCLMPDGQWAKGCR